MEETTKYIFGKSEFVHGIEIFPIRMKDYDEFMENSGILSFGLVHFPEEYQKDYKLLDLLTYATNEEFQQSLIKTLSLALKKEVIFVVSDENPKEYAYMAGDDAVINRNNFDEIRRVIMKQNLIFEKKVYNNPLVEKWANKVLEKRRKSSVKITVEDMITTIVSTGIPFESIQNMTIYQMNALFQRISKLESYRTTVAFKCAGAEKIQIEHFAEYINMFKDPYDDLFVKSDEKLDKFKNMK